jgi:hypothetical protein
MGAAEPPGVFAFVPLASRRLLRPQMPAKASIAIDPQITMSVSRFVRESARGSCPWRDSRS